MYRQNRQVHDWYNVCCTHDVLNPTSLYVCQLVSYTVLGSKLVNVWVARGPNMIGTANAAPMMS
jgi:hypothetical protein